MKGKLYKKENGWVIQYKMDSDLIATDGGEIPTHPNHSFWLKIWGETGMEMNFKIDDSGYAVLSANSETVFYPQD